jgi:hypothetical protein
MINYLCGNTPKLGDVVERVGHTVYMIIQGEQYTVTNIHLNTVNLQGHDNLHYHQEKFKLIKRKEVTMTNPNQQLLDYAVENIKEWDDHYPCLRADSSSVSLFYTDRSGWVNNGGLWKDDDISFHILSGALGKTTPQVITKDEWLAEIKRRQEEKGMNKPLERDKEYDVKLTGEQLAFLWYCVSNVAFSIVGVQSLHANLVSKFKQCDATRSYLSDSLLLRSDDKHYKEFLKVFFTPSETEEQRHLRELKEQYEALGDKIKQMEK